MDVWDRVPVRDGGIVERTLIASWMPLTILLQHHVQW